MKRRHSNSNQTKDNQLGQFLRVARENQGLTLSEVATKLGLKSPQAVWDWENAKGSGVPAEMLLKLVRIYNISFDQAFEHLLSFHQNRLRTRIQNRFAKARQKIFGL